MVAFRMDPDVTIENRAEERYQELETALQASTNRLLRRDILDRMGIILILYGLTPAGSVC